MDLTFSSGLGGVVYVVMAHDFYLIFDYVLSLNRDAGWEGFILVVSGDGVLRALSSARVLGKAWLAEMVGSDDAALWEFFYWS